MTETAKVKTKELPTDGNAGDTRWEDSVIPGGIARVTVRGIIGHCVTTKVYRDDKEVQSLDAPCLGMRKRQTMNFTGAEALWTEAMEKNGEIAEVVISETLDVEMPNCVRRRKQTASKVTLSRVKGNSPKREYKEE